MMGIYAMAFKMFGYISNGIEIMGIYGMALK